MYSITSKTFESPVRSAQMPAAKRTYRNLGSRKRRQKYGGAARVVFGAGGGGLFGGGGAQAVAPGMAALMRRRPGRSLLKEASHKHVITMLSDTSFPISITSNADGQPSFVAAGQSSANLSMEFSLDGAQIAIGGTNAVFCPLPGKATLVAMYDVYQIDSVDIRMFTANNATENDPQSGTPPIQPLFVVAPDTDDSANTTREDLLQYSTAQVVQPGTGNPLAISIKPAAAVQMYASLVSAGYGRVFSPELDMGNSNVPHYGVKMCCDVLRVPTAQVHAWVNFQIVYHLTCKSTR